MVMDRNIGNSDLFDQVESCPKGKLLKNIADDVIPVLVGLRVRVDK